MMFWIAFAVTILIYGVIAFLCSKNWQIGHVILLFFVALATTGALVLGAMVLKTHHEWRTAYTNGTQQLERVQSQIKQLERGSTLAPADDFKDIPTLKAELTRALIDRGRVWRNVTPLQWAEGAITLSMQGWGDQSCARAGIAGADEPLDETADGEGAPTPQASAAHGMSPGMILFAFAEIAPEEDRIPILYGEAALPQRDTNKACRLPEFFLGRFSVAQAEDQTIQLAPVYPLSDAQQQMAQQQVTWALYESMPKDRHDYFAGWTIEQIQMVFRKPDAVDAAEWQARLEEWIRDGQPADAGAPDGRQWVRIRFLQDTSIDVDAAEDAVTLERPFDATGRATQLGLRQGTPTQFKEGDILELSLPAARVIVASGSAELTDDAPVYRRGLIDFAQVLQSLQVSLHSEEQLSAVLAGDGDSIEVAIQKSKDLAVARQQEQQRLEDDLSQFQVEKDVITKVTHQLEAEREAQRRTMSRLYQSNRGLRDSLTHRSTGAAAVAQSPP